MAAVPHTPTPWRVSRGQLIRIHSGNVTIAGVHKVGRVEPLALANADFIIRAVNSHDRLLAALKAAYAELANPGTTARNGDDMAGAILRVIREAEAADV